MMTMKELSMQELGNVTGGQFSIEYHEEVPQRNDYEVYAPIDKEVGGWLAWLR